jgi:SAM-dependent methyltransferase
MTSEIFDQAVEQVRSCPLCGSDSIHLLERIQAEALARLVAQSISSDAGRECAVIDVLEYLLCKTCDLRFFNPALTGSERFYEQLQTFEWYYPGEKPEFEFARQYLGVHDTVLEVGCGSGEFAAQICVAKYVGLEFSAKAAAAARTRGLTVLQEPVEVHARAKSECYDAVCTFQVLEHVAQADNFLRGCLTLLKPGGLLIISVPSSDSFARGIPNFILDLPPHHVTRWSDRCLRGLPRQLPVDLVELWHESLQPVHLRMYIQSALNRLVYRALGSAVPAVEPGRIASAVLSLNLKLSRLLAPFVPTKNLRGISVTAIYRKTTA